jgi:proline dehydrogenase
MLLDGPLRAAILGAAGNESVRRTMQRHGFRLGAKRFVAGETFDDFLTVARSLNADGFAVACGILGENVRDRTEARSVSDEYCRILRTFAGEGIDANVAFKLTHVGLDIDPELAYDNAIQIAQTAEQNGNTIRFDMEQSGYVDRTLAIHRRIRQQFDCVGCVLQSYLRRTWNDLAALLPLEPNIRLVKGAYLESPDRAYPRKSDVDQQYVRLAERALSEPGYTAIATHDPAIIEHIIAYAKSQGLPRCGRYEFQMLYGIAGALARRLCADGYRVRIAVPFGTYWFPYLMRRLAERPANVAFFLKGLLARQ